MEYMGIHWTWKYNKPLIFGCYLPIYILVIELNIDA